MLYNCYSCLSSVLFFSYFIYLLIFDVSFALFRCMFAILLQFLILWCSIGVQTRSEMRADKLLYYMTIADKTISEVKYDFQNV